MKQVVERISKKNILFKELQRVEKTHFGIRNRFEIYYGVDIKNRYTLIIHIEQKSRFILKNIDTLESILHIFMDKMGHNFASKIVIIDSPICSKAKAALMSLGWRFV